MVWVVGDLPEDLKARLAGQDVIFFDGTCVLCSGFYRFVLRVDREQVFRFATAQSDLGQALYAALGLDTTNYETNLVVRRGHIHAHLDSFAAVMRALGGIWRVPGAVGWLPQRIKTPLYACIARNRYRLFGRYDTCVIPDAATRARFVPGGW